MADLVASVGQAELQTLITAIQARLEAVEENAAAASAKLDVLRDAAQAAARTAFGDSDAEDARGTALRSIDTRCAEIEDGIALVRAAKVSALEAEIVAADAALEQLQARESDGDDLHRGALLQAFGRPPLEPVELATVLLVPVEQGEAIAQLYAPRGVVPSEVVISGVPHAVIVKEGTAQGAPSSLCFDVGLRQGDASQGSDEANVPNAPREARAARVESLASRLRVSASLAVAAARSSDEGGGEAEGGYALLSVPLEAALSVSETGDGVRVSIRVPVPLPPALLAAAASAPSACCCVRLERISLGGTSLLSADDPLSIGIPIRARRTPGPIRGRGALYDACSKGVTAAVLAVLASPPDGWSTEETGDVRFRTAGEGVYVRFPPSYTLLLAAQDGYTCLIWACYYGSIRSHARPEIVRALIDAGANVHAAAAGVVGASACLVCWYPLSSFSLSRIPHPHCRAAALRSTVRRTLAAPSPCACWSKPVRT